MSLSLPFLLNSNQEKLGNQYENFLTDRGWFPAINSKNQWILARNIPKLFRDRKTYFKDLAEKIVQNGQEIAHLPHPENLVRRFNIEWMTAQRVEELSSMTETDTPIWFNSKSRDYSWLSNFFMTLIYSWEPIPGIFIGVESAYKTYQAALAGADSETVAELAQITNLKKAKKKSVNIDQELKVSLMRTLIKLKFSQNQILAEHLKATAHRQLIEHTDNRFWGDGSSTGSEESGDGLNMLGQILMEERDFLLTR